MFRREINVVRGYKVRALRNALGWSQKVLAKKSGVCLRTITAIETEKGVVRREFVGLLAQALGVDPDTLIWWQDIDWRFVPPLPSRRQRESVAEALQLDMLGEHEMAARILRAVLERRDHRDAWCDSYVELRIKLISTLDNAGHHEEAIAECDRMLQEPRAEGGWVRRWVRYHRAIALRRLGRFAETEVALEQLLADDDPCAFAVLHQRGVLCIARAKHEPAQRSQYLDQAAGYLEAALERWKQVEDRTKQGHRKGYTLLRLSEVADLQGNGPAAIEYAIQAHAWFNWHHAHRYAEEAGRELRRLIELHLGRRDAA